MASDSSVVAEYDGVQIVQDDDDWVSYIEGTRIRPYDIGTIIEEDGRTLTHIATNTYPHLTETQVQAAYKYYQSNPTEMQNITQLKKEYAKLSELKVYECTCGERFQGVKQYKSHIDTPTNHTVADVTTDSITIICSCGEQFETPLVFMNHRHTNPNHRLHTIQNHFIK